MATIRLLFGGSSADLRVQRLSEGNNSLLWSNDGSLDEEEIVRDLSVVRESTHWGNALLGEIEFSGSVGSSSLSDSVDFLVGFNSVEVSVLTSSWEVGGQAVLGRQNILPTPWLTERHGYDPT